MEHCLTLVPIGHACIRTPLPVIIHPSRNFHQDQQENDMDNSTESDTQVYRKKWWQNVEAWAWGLASGFIGGGASAVTASFSAAAITPEQYNLKAGLSHFVELFIVTFFVSGILSAMAYLRQSPLPPLPEMRSVTVTSKVTVTESPSQPQNPQPPSTG